MGEKVTFFSIEKRLSQAFLLKKKCFYSMRKPQQLSYENSIFYILLQFDPVGKVDCCDFYHSVLTFLSFKLVPIIWFLKFHEK